MYIEKKKYFYGFFKYFLYAYISIKLGAIKKLLISNAYVSDKIQVTRYEGSLILTIQLDYIM